jgi:tetratricopeptide (TPR) repeat protein
VLIYLARAVTQSFLDRLAGWLAPGGLVFLGYSEAVLAPTDRLRIERLGDTHALRVVPNRSGRLRSPTGELGAEPPGSRVPGGPATVADDEPATAADMAEAGAVAAARGDPEAAVVAFRKAVFLDPDQPAAWFQLGLALGAVQDRRGARRAYAAALAALERCDQGAVRAGLDGWPAGELAGVLRAKLGRP